MFNYVFWGGWIVLFVVDGKLGYIFGIIAGVLVMVLIVIVLKKMVYE